jgi:hypothetical protein
MSRVTDSFLEESIEFEKQIYRQRIGVVRANKKNKKVVDI